MKRVKRVERVSHSSSIIHLSFIYHSSIILLSFFYRSASICSNYVTRTRRPHLDMRLHFRFDCRRQVLAFRARDDVVVHLEGLLGEEALLGLVDDREHGADSQHAEGVHERKQPHLPQLLIVLITAGTRETCDCGV